MGAWIETSNSYIAAHRDKSHPIWVRGLKQVHSEIDCGPCSSHPIWVRGLKLRSHDIGWRRNRSHPIWVRGLKL